MKAEEDWDDLIIKKLTESLSADEESRLNKHLASDSEMQERFVQFQKLWNESDHLQLRSGLAPEARWNSLQEKIHQDHAKKSPRSHKTILRYAMAAVVLLFILFLFYPHTSAVEISTLRGEMKTVTLPDQSIVTLNAETTLRYDPALWDEERGLVLTGEAFFKVKRNGLPFIVTSSNAVVKVLGTTFNVRARKGITAIVCATGKVSVGPKNRTSKTVTLQSGYGTTVNGLNLEPVYAVSSEEEVSWLSGGLHFNNAPLKDVFAELERHFNKSIRVSKNLGKQTFTGKFKHAQFQEVLKTVCLSAGLKCSLAADSSAVIE
jgi:transmembrane sensor